MPFRIWGHVQVSLTSRVIHSESLRVDQPPGLLRPAIPGQGVSGGDVFRFLDQQAVLPGCRRLLESDGARPQGQVRLIPNAPIMLRVHLGNLCRDFAPGQIAREFRVPFLDAHANPGR